MNTISRTIMSTVLAIAALGIAVTLPAGAQTQPIKIGMSMAVTGYLADMDQSIRDGALLAIEKLNREGGVLGRKFEYVIEDMRSEPQQEVTVINKLIVSDKVNLLLNGHSSAGNAAAAPIGARNKIPMILASILPPAEQAESVRWCFSTLAPSAFEIPVRYGYLQKKTNIKKIGIIHDPTPYITMMKNVGLAEAPKYGLTVAGVEQYKVDDTDMKAQLTKLVAFGAEAILKFGVGPTTIVVAKNIRELGMTIPMLTSTGDMVAEFRPSAEALGERFFFVAYLPQVPEVLAPDNPVRKAQEPFFKAWFSKYPGRDAAAPARGWDAINFVAAGIKSAGSIDGEKVRTALEGLGDFVGASTIYQFTDKVHAGVQMNPLKLVQIINGKARLTYDLAAEK